MTAVKEAFGVDPATWSKRRRVDHGSRSVVAYLARRQFGCAPGEVAKVLCYRAHVSVG